MYTITFYKVLYYISNCNIIVIDNISIINVNVIYYEFKYNRLQIEI